MDTGTPELILHKRLNIEYKCMLERQKNPNNHQPVNILLLVILFLDDIFVAQFFFKFSKECTTLL